MAHQAGFAQPLRNPFCTNDELMELYVDTLQKCGLHLLKMSDEYIGYYIFEEFDGGAISFLHENTLSKLKTANLINKKALQKSSELRSKFMKLQNTDLWDVDAVKNSNKWREILELSDEIKLLLSVPLSSKYIERQFK